MNLVTVYTIAFPFLIAFLATIVAVPFSLIFIRKFKIYDDPKLHKHPAIIHKKPIPRAGSIPLFIGIFAASLLFLPISKITSALFFASFLSVVIGVLDDKLDISPYLRFFVNISIATILIGSGISIPFITNPFGGTIHLDAFRFSFGFIGIHWSLALSDVVAILWIVWVMNMLNWSKGVDGQMPGIVAISAIVIGILSLRFIENDPNSLLAAKLSFIIAGSALGFLLYNFYPAKIFPGYGATSLYLLLAVVSIFSGAKLATAILVMGVPMIDGIFTVARRIASGKSPFWHDNRHLHHILLRLGFSQREIALFYWFISAILGTISLTLTSTGKIFAIIMLFVILGGTILFLHITLKQNEDEIIH